MSRIYESTIEEYLISLLEHQSYEYLPPELVERERVDARTGEMDFTMVVLVERLNRAIDRLNPGVTSDAKEQALKRILSLSSQELIENNCEFHQMITEGVEVEVMHHDGIRGEKVYFIDYTDITANEFLVTNQFTVKGEKLKRPDVVILVNGLPLVVIELKNPTDENATTEKAYTQLQNYKNAIPQLFYYNSILVASDGYNATSGSLTADYSRFLAWKTSDGKKEDKHTIPQIETMTHGMLDKATLLDLIRNFTVFETSKKEDPQTGITTLTTIKKIAAYHQYYGVNKAVESTRRAVGDISDMVREDPVAYGVPSASDQPIGDRKVGVMWHTQGSGKSLSMVFYSGKVVQEFHNPTIVVITDRNDLDDQLFDTFANCKQLLRQEPVQAESRKDMRNLLKVAGGGIIFTTIQKFFPEDGSTEFEELSSRKNIIVIADEAHRSQYGFAGKNKMTNDGAGIQTRYGFAKYLRDALPHASFIGFTGTPVEKTDASTLAVFGNYIDVYDIAQAVEDKATVPIYYESRLAKVHLKEEEREILDDEVETLLEGQEESLSQKAKAKWAQLQAIVGHQSRLEVVARDLVTHYEKRQEAMKGKAMVVCMSRKIAVDLYEEIIKLRPQWHDDDQIKGKIKVVMTSSSSDPETWQKHHTNKEERKALGERFKDTNDPLDLVIVRDMWLTGFDVPAMHTMYIDKQMQGHNLMQAIARVNRVYKDKPGGLIVDYIGIATDLKNALKTYTESGGEGNPTENQNEAVSLLLEKHDVVTQILHGFNYQEFFSADTGRKLQVILEAEDFILGIEEGKERFVREVTALSKAFALATPHPKALEIEPEVSFFQGIKARIVKFIPGSGSGKVDIETAIKQIVDRAVVSDGIVDIFDAAGIQKPDISILSDEFMDEVRNMKHKNLAAELLKKLLNDEIKVRSKHNLVVGKKLSEMLQGAINRYHNNVLTTVELIEELIRISKEVKKADQRGEDLGLTEDELAFYDALAQNESARELLGDKQLVQIATEVLKSVRGNASIDWTLKENVRAKLRRDVKRILAKYGYPPDQTLNATLTILGQAELLAVEWNK
ncbi:MAG: type I restriction endonuclease subunit R [Candidatus Dojkabacteria bacterium]